MGSKGLSGMRLGGCCALAMAACGAAVDAQTNRADVTELVVTASRREVSLRDTAEVVQVIDRKEIEELNPSKTGELLDYVTGVSVETGTGVGMPNRSVVSLNGLPASYTLVLVDGVRLLSEHIHTGQNLENIPPQAIERIEIMRGAASAQYGTGPIGGIVNIVTRKCDGTPEVRVEAAGGSYDTREGGLSLLLPMGEMLRLSSFARWEESDGTPLTAPASRVGHVGYTRLNLLNRVDADLGEDADVFASVNYVGNTMDFNKGTSTTPDWGTADMYLVTPVLGGRRALSPSLDIAGQVAYSLWDNEASLEKNVFCEPEAHATWRLSDAQTLMAGGDYRWNEFERSKVPSHEQEAFGAFLQHEWRPGETFSTLAALRGDKVEDVDAAWSPKLAAKYAPVESVRMRASVAQGFHAPTLQELYEDGFGHGGRARRYGNPDLEPESSTTYTLGLEWLPLDVLDLVLHGYFSDVEDMIVPVFEGASPTDAAIDVWRRQNIANAEVYGGEAALRWRMTDRLSFETGYSRTENEDKDTGRQLPYRPGSSAYGKLTASHAPKRSVSVSAFVAVKGGFDREAWNWKPAAGVAPDNADGLTTPLKDYTRLDAGIVVAWHKTYEAFVKVENILGEDIENLDDAYTVLDGEPVVRVGLAYNLPLAK